MGHEGGRPGGNTGDSHVQRSGSVVYRKVSVKGSGGVTATIVVTAQRGKVWVSIEPPFIWEAIMEPEKVDELIRTLGQAGDDAKRRVSSKSVSRGDTQPVGSGTVGNTSPHQEP